MKIGIISDIHSNLEALKTIINKFNEENVDIILCAGDLIGLGPNPNEVIEYLMTLSNFISVLGNHEFYSGLLPWLKHYVKLKLGPLYNSGVVIDNNIHIVDCIH